ncbi:T9SS type A sorting domain-containing protein [Lentimicrobium sp. S6]|uniref:T9SS type A sorting domain-containing protein n=1 Tax=Lentimicrobium sp. S6 TaxID=2735872 RepID=UPI00155737B1|nr:T9SS type A sorting domain-containing protein [Lentimicrobium sp. S6]NPD45256.1 T9SS type A sorting domain-containing protein [Lentimicrobium sp. S6]
MRKTFYIIILFILGFHQLFAQTNLTEAGDFEVTDLDGNDIHLFDLLDNQGKYVLIDFYFTTCVPCQGAVPKVSEAYEYFGCGEFDIEFIAMDYGNTDEQCHEFDEEFGVAYPSVSGVEGGGTAVCEAYGIPVYPTFVLIAPDHSILEQNIWPIPTAESLIEVLEGYGINQNFCALEADFIAYNNDICAENYMLFHDRSLGEITNWEWTFEGGYPPTSSEENPMIYFPDPGNFDVSLTVSNADSEITYTQEELARVHNCMGTASMAASNLTISPNPSSGIFQVKWAQKESYDITLTDLKGKILYQESSIHNNHNLDISHLKNGVYLLKLNSIHHNEKHKIIIR